MSTLVPVHVSTFKVTLLFSSVQREVPQYLPPSSLAVKKQSSTSSLHSLFTGVFGHFLQPFTSAPNHSDGSHIKY